MSFFGNSMNRAPRVMATTRPLMTYRAQPSQPSAPFTATGRPTGGNDMPITRVTSPFAPGRLSILTRPADLVRSMPTRPIALIQAKNGPFKVPTFNAAIQLPIQTTPLTPVAPTQPYQYGPMSGPSNDGGGPSPSQNGPSNNGGESDDEGSEEELAALQAEYEALQADLSENSDEDTAYAAMAGVWITDRMAASAGREYTQPGTTSGFPPNGEPYPMGAEMTGAFVPYSWSAGGIALPHIPANVEEMKALARKAFSWFVQDPGLYLGVASRVFLPGLGWIPFLSWEAFRAYRAVR